MHDLISRILQFDNDGDKALVVADKNFVDIAERNMNNVVPLYYEMKKAKSVLITPENIYNGLIHAFTGGNIGPYSNNITKIWNSDIFVNGSEEDKQEAIDTVKLLCMENNFVIDYAKTLYKPVRPEKVAKQIAKFTQKKLPHFFVYAKDKMESQVEERNQSFVNKLYDIVPNVQINTRKLKIDEIEYDKMMFDVNTKVDKNVIEIYDRLNKQYRYKFNIVDERVANDSFVKQTILKEFEKTGYSAIEITDMLVKHLYSKNKRYKQLLWFVYGEYIVENLKHHVVIKPTKKVQCVDCGELFEVYVRNAKKVRCDSCQKVFKRNYQRELMQKRKQNGII